MITIDKTIGHKREITTIAKKLYVLKRFEGPMNKRFSFIQFSYRTGKPVINSDIGYKLGSYVTFDNKEDACKFLKTFLTEKDRWNEEWAVCEYEPQNRKDLNFEYKETYTRFGKCLHLCRVTKDNKYGYGGY